MHYAAINGHKNICSLLLEKGADIAARDQVSDAAIVDVYHTCMPSRAHTYISPPPGDLTNPYIPPYKTFRTHCIFSLPHYPPLFLPTPSSRTPMTAIIAGYRVYAHYYQRVGMYVCEPARVAACMFALGLPLFRIAFCGPIDCGPAVRGRIGWISCQVTFQE